MMLNQLELFKLLNYNPYTGVFIWLNSKGARINFGDIAGTLKSDGYIRIVINKERHSAHRLAWLYMTGTWPKNQIDHINRIKYDNRFCNLREATNSQNQINKNKQINNISGHKGINWYKRDKVWFATIRHNGKLIYIGQYNNLDAAIKARQEYAEKLYSDFAR